MSRFKQLLTQLPILSRVNRWFGKFLTPVGKAVLLATFFFLVGSSHLDTPVYQLFGASVSLLIISGVTVRFFRPNLDYRFNIPSYVRAGVPFEITLRIRNVGSRVALDTIFSPDTSDFRQHGMICESRSTMYRSIAPKQSVRLTFQVTATRRGVFQLPAFKMRTSFPFNLFYVTEVIRRPNELVVTPDFKPIVSLDSVRNEVGALSGMDSKNPEAGTDEFAGSREYTPGMPTRRWDYRAWARLGTPHVCQFEKEVVERVSIVLDFSNCNRDDFSEAAISLAASLASWLDDSQLELEFLFIGNRSFHLAPLTGIERFNEICVRLAKINLYHPRDLVRPQLPALVDQTVFWIIPADQVIPADALDSPFSNRTRFVPVLVGDASDLANNAFHFVPVDSIYAGGVHL